jgi:hypothetical protein
MFMIQVTDSLGNVTTYFKGSLIVKTYTMITITENLTTVTILLLKVR